MNWTVSSSDRKLCQVFESWKYFSCKSAKNCINAFHLFSDIADMDSITPNLLLTQRVAFLSQAVYGSRGCLGKHKSSVKSSVTSFRLSSYSTTYPILNIIEFVSNPLQRQWSRWLWLLMHNRPAPFGLKVKLHRWFEVLMEGSGWQKWWEEDTLNVVPLLNS